MIGLLVLAAAVLELVPALVVRHVIDDSLVRGDTAELPRSAVLYLAAATGVTALSAGYGYLAATVARRSLAGLWTRLFAHLLALPTSYHDRTPLGTPSPGHGRRGRHRRPVLLLGRDGARRGGPAVTVAVAMIVLSPVLAAASALVIPPLILLTNVLRRRVRDAERAREWPSVP